MTISPTLLERINHKREVLGYEDCWPWVRGSIRIQWGLHKGETTELRRAVWLLDRGQFPERYQHIEVTCKNTKCLNPRHLYIQTEEQRFWSKVDQTGGPDSCWMWKGTVSYHGQYGQFQFRVKADGSARAHRLAWEYTTGEPLDPSVFLCHKCDVPLCVNPAHMFTGSPLDNQRDMIAKGRAAWQKDPVGFGRKISAAAQRRASPSGSAGSND